MRKILKIATYGTALVLALAIVGAMFFAIRVGSREPLRAISSTTHPSISRQECIDCHAPIAEEWRSSYHYQSLRGPYWKDVRELGYLKIFEKTRKACINCHAPANVLDVVDSFATGDASDAGLGVECTPNLLREPQGTMPAARTDDVDLGVDCTSCHVSRLGVVGAGRHPTPAHETTSDRRFLDPASTAQHLCRTCHKATVEAWSDTSLATSGITCLDCHMPGVEAPSVAGGPARSRRSHRFAGDKDPSMLAEAFRASLTITGDRKARFSVRNDGAGHLFPSGGNWLSVQFKIYDVAGNVTSQRLEAFGKEEALVLDFWPFNTDDRIAFGEQREIFVPLPETPGMVEAVVRYHDWMRTKQTLLTLAEKF